MVEQSKDQPVLDLVFSTRLIEVLLATRLVVAFEKSIGEAFGDLEGVSNSRSERGEAWISRRISGVVRAFLWRYTILSGSPRSILSSRLEIDLLAKKNG